MSNQLKKNFLQFQKAYAPVNINDNNDITQDEIKEFEYNDKIDILPIFNCNIWFGDYEGYDSFTRRYRVPYPITGLTYNSKSIFNVDILNKLEFCLRIIMLLNEDFSENIQSIKTKYQTVAPNYIENIELLKNLTGLNDSSNGTARVNYFNNFFNNGTFKIEGKDYKVNDNELNNDFYLFKINLVDDKKIRIYDKDYIITNPANEFSKLQYLIKFSLNKVANYGLYNVKDNSKSFIMRKNDKDLDEDFDKAPIDNNKNKCSFILTKPNNKNYTGSSLAKDIVENEKAYL